ncbi:MAG: MBG-2 domain-containing protein [Chloroflexi bacterium]|nr:MBG-2 domain-containing protein [Chloroflexota bacterium]
MTVTADPQTKVYGDADPALTFTTSSLGSGVAITGSLSRIAGETVASSPYAILQGTVTNANNPNYSITYVGANLAITARPVTVTPASGQSKVFGLGDATLTFALSEVVGVSGSLGRAPGEAVGSYPITLGTLVPNSSNYTLVLSLTTVNFTILGWSLNGFYQPVDMGFLNTVKGGSTVPLKFEIFQGSTELTNVTAIKGFKATLTNCLAFVDVPADAIEMTATGGTSLRYDGSGGQFIQNWQTPKSPGACYSVSMQTQDGSVIYAHFKLK